MRTLFLILIFIVGSNVYSQDERRFFLGVNVGTKIANKNYAARYAGWYNNQLVETMLNNPTHYNNIYTLLNNQNFTLPYDYAPLNMRYSPGLVAGVLAGFQLSPNLQASIDANFISLRAKDVFSVVVDDPSNTTSQEQYQLGNLFARESRFNGKFNFDYVSDGEKAKFIIGLSGIFSAWRIDQHYASFPAEVYQMQLFSRHDPTNNITHKVSDIGWGGGINLGIDYRLNEQFVLQLIYQPQHVSLDVGVNANPNKKLRLQHDIVLRVLWK